MATFDGEALRRAAYRVLRGVGRGVDVVLLLVMVGSLVWWILRFVPEAADSAATRRLEEILGPTWAAVRGLAARAGAGTTVGGHDVAPLVVVAAAMLARNATNWRLDRLGAVEHRRRAKTAMATAAGPADDPEDQARRLAAARRVAVAAYTDAKAVLEATKMELTFLSLDVVGSTRMKQGEDPFVIEQAFTDYRTMIDRALKRHAAYKSTWTPDGQMAAFKDAQAAVACAQEILSSLPEFNAKVSRLKTPFVLRCGANVGVVSTDDATPMEKISDFSIDVAGHMQKHADVDSLWISADLHARLTDPAGFAAAGRQVDGRDVFSWKRP
jgi:class 3 adenylate cyclase